LHTGNAEKLSSLSAATEEEFSWSLHQISFMRAIRKVTSSELLTKEAMRKHFFIYKKYIQT
jgi:hypothetical protein